MLRLIRRMEQVSIVDVRTELAIETGFTTPSKYLLNHRQCAADKVAIAIREVAVISLDQSVEAEAAVLTERNLAQQEITKDVGGKEVLLMLPVLIAQHRAGAVCRAWA